MTARVQHAISTRFGIFHTWKNKNIFVKKNLLEKYKSLQFDRLTRAVADRNLSSKRTARAGIIKGLSVAYLYNRRKKESKKPIIKVGSSYFDILLQDIHWKKKWKWKKMLNKVGKSYKFMYFLLRRQTMKLIQKRLHTGLSNYYFIPKHSIKNNLYSFSYKYSTANFLAFYIVRRLVIRYSLKEIIAPYLKRHRKWTYGLKISAYGRFTRRQRSHKQRFGHGPMPLGTVSMPIDYKRANCRLRYGVCGIRVWVLQMRPTYQAMKAYHKNYSYFRVIRAARAARKAKNREYDLQVKYKKKRQRRIKRKNQGRCTTLIKSIKKIEYI